MRELLLRSRAERTIHLDCSACVFRSSPQSSPPEERRKKCAPGAGADVPPYKFLTVFPNQFLSDNQRHPRNPRFRLTFLNYLLATVRGEPTFAAPKSM